MSRHLRLGAVRLVTLENGLNGVPEDSVWKDLDREADEAAEQHEVEPLDRSRSRRRLW